MFSVYTISILNSANYSSLRVFESCLVFTPAKTYFTYFSVTTQIDSWKSNGMSEEDNGNITESDDNFAPFFVNYDVLLNINFNGQCGINNTYMPKKVYS